MTQTGENGSRWKCLQHLRPSSNIENWEIELSCDTYPKVFEVIGDHLERNVYQILILSPLINHKQFTLIQIDFIS